MGFERKQNNGGTHFSLKVQHGIISDVIIYPEMDISRNDKKNVNKNVKFHCF